MAHVGYTSVGRQRWLRKEILKAFGGRCAKCGFADSRALQLDHIGGGGRRMRISKGQHGVYRYALKYRDKFQLLCANCNSIKKFENGER